LFIFLFLVRHSAPASPLLFVTQQVLPGYMRGLVYIRAGFLHGGVSGGG
jgi:hypothetical protein